MTVRDLIEKLQAIEPTCGNLHVFQEYDDDQLLVSGVEVYEMECGGDWARYVALVVHDPGAGTAPPRSTS